VYSGVIPSNFVVPRIFFLSKHVVKTKLLPPKLKNLATGLSGAPQKRFQSGPALAKTGPGSQLSVACETRGPSFGTRFKRFLRIQS